MRTIRSMVATGTFRRAGLGALAVLLLLYVGCHGEAGTRRAEEQAREYVIRPEAATLKELEASVLDGGHQPWRLNPLSVAEVALACIIVNGLAEADISREFEAINDQTRWRMQKVDGKLIAILKGNNHRAMVVLGNTDPSPAEQGIWFADRLVIKRVYD